MTKEEINKAIAERVMGWHESDGAWWDNQIQLMFPVDATQWGSMGTGFFNPAERIDHAWMVVEKHSFYSVCKIDDHYFVVFDMINGPRADTAPMAICLATLEAVGGKR